MKTYFETIKVCISILLLTMALQSSSETIFVGGLLEESEVWTKDNIYVVYQDLVVPGGVSL